MEREPNMSHLLMRRPDLENLPAVPTLPEGYVLRLYQETDLDSLATLMREAFDDAQWTPERVKETLTDSSDVKAVYVIDCGGQIVATASARLLPDVFPGSGYLHWLAVSPAHRGKQLGYTITLAVLHAFVRLGCKDAVLETQDQCLAAIKIYQSVGFVPTPVHETHPERWARIVDLLAAIGL
ncbi:MAG: GCN5-like N-acetyltransferase [Chthonomonadaceae bacterium]|nr:GCN5-like N-acetyltransferase [Chthonomonadaceae bacterium]